MMQKGLPGAFRPIALGAALLFGALGLGAARADEVNGLAAMTLQNVVDDAAAAYEKQSGVSVRFSYASSAALVKQIENGAPADIFISADSDWMDEAEHKGLIKVETRVDLLSSRLVLVAARDKAKPTPIKRGFPIGAMLGDGHLVMCDPMMMPAGRYGRAALESLGVWQVVQDRVANAENVRAALAFVSRGEAPLGIVFDTDAALDPGVKIVGVFPPESHPPILYPAAVIESSEHPEAEAFLAFLQSAPARSIFERYGYVFLPATEKETGH